MFKFQSCVAFLKRVITTRTGKTNDNLFSACTSRILLTPRGLTLPTIRVILVSPTSSPRVYTGKRSWSNGATSQPILVSHPAIRVQQSVKGYRSLDGFVHQVWVIVSIPMIQLALLAVVNQSNSGTVPRSLLTKKPRLPRPLPHLRPLLRHKLQLKHLLLLLWQSRVLDTVAMHISILTVSIIISFAGHLN